MEIFLIFSFFHLIVSSATIVVAKNIEREMHLDFDERYHLKWTVDFTTKVATFTAIVKTTGFVGLGISGSPTMAGADIVIGGVKSNGEAYFGDYYATRNGYPETDTTQHWSLLSANEANGITTLRFSRLLATCDEHDHDVELTEDTQYLIWAIGVTDTIEKHTNENRGAVTVNFLDPVTSDNDFSKFSVWNIVRENYVVPSSDTTYWCTIHEMAPDFDGTKTHIVAFDIILTSSADRRHVHHAILHRCTPPDGSPSETYFGDYVIGKHKGDFCYESDPEPLIPTYACVPFYVWSIGGGPLVLPPDVGYAMGKTGQKEYVMLEVHYDNPDGVSGAVTNAGVAIYYTEEMRPINGGVMVVGHYTGHHQMIPPNTKDFVTVAHCGSACTEFAIPPGGVNIFNALLHSHLVGRKVKVRQFRKTEELPWIAADNHYDFNYQATRTLRDHVKFLPGDHLSVECTYDTTGRSRVTIGGHPSQAEMCHAMLWFYPYKTFISCESRLDPMTPLLDLFGIIELNWNGQMNQDPIVASPASLVNRTYSSVLNDVSWTNSLKREVHNLRFARQGQTCYAGEPLDGNSVGSLRAVNYPKLTTKEYKPVSACPVRVTNSNSDDSGSQGLEACQLVVLLLLSTFLLNL